MPNYQKLKTMVKRKKDQKQRLQNFDARHWRNETGAVIKNRKGLSGVEGGKGTCYQWKEKGQCSKGDQCSFPHESNVRAKKPEHTAATPSGPTVSRGLSVSCRYYLKGTCTRSPSECWHAPECQLYKTETGCKAGDKCLFPHQKVDEKQKQKAPEGYHSQKKKRKRRQECCGYFEKCTTIGLRLARLGCIGFLKRKTVPGKPDA